MCLKKIGEREREKEQRREQSKRSNYLHGQVVRRRQNVADNSIAL